MQTDDFSDSLPGYALEALELSEMDFIAHHLEECPACRDELEGYRAVIAALWKTMDAAPPPPSLKNRVIGRVATAAGLHPAAG